MCRTASSPQAARTTRPHPLSCIHMRVWGLLATVGGHALNLPSLHLSWACTGNGGFGTHAVNMHQKLWLRVPLHWYCTSSCVFGSPGSLTQ